MPGARTSDATMPGPPETAGPQGMFRSATGTLAEVAVQCGFCDQSQLSRTFMRQVGITPGRFRSGRAG